MALTFHKLHGAGNDFVLLDLRDQQLELDAGRARALADRHTGIGCDQLLVLRPSTATGQVARFEIWNSDGSTAQQCGNGMRAIGIYLRRRGESPDTGVRLAGPAGEVHIQCLSADQVRVDMGRPELDPAAIPLNLSPDKGWYDLEVAGRPVRFGAASMGNPHAVVPVDTLDDGTVEAIGPVLSRHPAFPEGCNAGFARVEDAARVRLRVWERGAGETRACGSGACAAAVVLQTLGRVGERVTVVQAGGTLIIEWRGGDEPVFMTGPAVHVFEGTME